METHNHHLNIHYTVPEKYWHKMLQLYEKMPEWRGYKDGMPTWYGYDNRLINVFMEPSGLSFYAELPKEDWERWFYLFRVEATVIMGYEVGEPEEGFDFIYYD